LSVPRNSARFVGELIAPRSWRETVIVVIGGYIDGSNLHGDVDVIAVAGCAANVKAWPDWEDKWKEILKISGLPRWHHTDFIAKKKKIGREYSIWPEAEWLLCRRLLCEAFEAVKPTCFGATILRTDYEALRVQFPSLLPEDPYFFLLDRCLHRLIQGMFEHPVDEGVAIYCDQDKNEQLVKDLAHWHTAYLRAADHFGHPDDGKRAVTMTYGSNVDYVPLQAADVVAHELMSFARTNPDMRFVATNRDSNRWIIDRLKGQFPWFAQCYTKEWIEMELNGRAWVPGHWPGFRFVAPEP
jgi:hypothetical protein